MTKYKYFIAANNNLALEVESLALFSVSCRGSSVTKEVWYLNFTYWEETNWAQSHGPSRTISLKPTGWLQIFSDFKFFLTWSKFTGDILKIYTWQETLGERATGVTFLSTYYTECVLRTWTWIGHMLILEELAEIQRGHSALS